MANSYQINATHISLDTVLNLPTLGRSCNTFTLLQSLLSPPFARLSGVAPTSALLSSDLLARVCLVLLYFWTVEIMISTSQTCAFSCLSESAWFQLSAPRKYSVTEQSPVTSVLLLEHVLPGHTPVLPQLVLE